MNKYNIGDYVEIKEMLGLFGCIFQIQEINLPIEDAPKYLYSINFSQIGCVYHAFWPDIVRKFDE